MSEAIDDLLAERFEAHRPRLRAVARRMVGSAADADDAVQETWLRLQRTTEPIDNLGGWLTTVVSRLCLNALQARRTRREDPLDDIDDPADDVDPLAAPEREALLADSVGAALQVVLDSLTPAERLAFVLHDLFAVPFDRVAEIAGRTPAATRQLASRARRRVRDAAVPDPDHARRRALVTAFLAAARAGDFDGLLAVLDPSVRVRTDATAAAMGAAAYFGGTELNGADDVARAFGAGAKAARPALIDGVPGLVWAKGGAPQVLFELTYDAGRIVGIELRADPDRLAGADLVVL